MCCCVNILFLKLRAKAGEKWLVCLLQANTQLRFPLPTTLLLFPRMGGGCRVMGEVMGILSLNWDKWLGAEGVVEPGLGSQMCKPGSFPWRRWAACHPAALKPMLAAFPEGKKTPNMDVKATGPCSWSSSCCISQGVWGRDLFFSFLASWFPAQPKHVANSTAALVVRGVTDHLQKEKPRVQVSTVSRDEA